MKFFDNEKNILNLIKYGAIVPVIIFSFIITYIFINQKKQDVKNEVEILKANYLNENKKIVKYEVENIISLINDEISKAEESLKESIKNKVYEAYKVANILYTEESNDFLNEQTRSKERILTTIKHALTGMSYNNNRGYFFMDDINGVKLLQPFNKEFEGKNMLNYEDAKGYKFVKKISETIKNKTEAFDKYYWYKPNDKTQAYEKISFYKYFEPYNVVIGTGEYTLDFQEKIKKKVLEWITRFRYSENGYIFVYDLNGNCLSDIRKECIGQNRLKVKNSKGDFVVKDILNFAKANKEGYLDYLSTYNANYKSSAKISYIKLFEKWNWVIGNGFYLDRLNSVLKQREIELTKNSNQVINKILIISSIMTLILIAISFYVSNIIATKFKEYRENLDLETKKTIKNEMLLIQQSKMAIMGEMIGNIAHQWKQPLSLISMSNSLLRLNKENESHNSEEEISEAIDNIDNSVVHLTTTIDDFRNFFNPSKEKTYFNIETIFEKTLKLISSEFKTSNIEIVKNIKETYLSGYQNELLQVFINIIKNAKDESIKNPNKTQKQYVFIDVFEDKTFLYIKIKDTNGGIPKDILSDVFKPYFTTKKEIGGTGIGLYMSKQIITNMNGEINATNEEFQYNNETYIGAQFSIKLPKNTL
ncbi:cache domain-containing protein [Arcobacter sp. KX21116]|uniref:sensor histidine kinase n=1 Tax=Arcobacter iocasae TaxID=2906515 RepID=UPI0035D41431